MKKNQRYYKNTAQSCGIEGFIFTALKVEEKIVTIRFDNGEIRTISKSSNIFKSSILLDDAFFSVKKKSAYTSEGVKRTLEEFGYDPREIVAYRLRKIAFAFAKCKVCKEDSPINLDGLHNGWGYQDDICVYCLDSKEAVNAFLSFKEKFSRNIFESFALENNRELNLSTETIDRIVNGRRHNSETKAKISALLTGRKLSEEHCAKISKRMKGHIPTSSGNGRGNGQYYTCKQGRKIWMRSGWEAKYAKWLDDNGHSWEYEPKAFDVNFEYLGIFRESTYRPDFFVNEEEWHEVKGFWRDDALPKFEAFKEQHPDIKIKVLMREDLKELGIKIK